MAKEAKELTTTGIFSRVTLVFRRKEFGVASYIFFYRAAERIEKTTRRNSNYTEGYIFEPTVVSRAKAC